MDGISDHSRTLFGFNQLDSFPLYRFQPQNITKNTPTSRNILKKKYTKTIPSNHINFESEDYRIG